MVVEYSFSEEDGYLLVDISGRYDLDEAKRVIRKVLDECKERRLDHVLIDFLKLEGVVSSPDRFSLGNTAAEVWGPVLKVACIYREKEISHFLDTVARNRSARVRIFADKKNALDWLLSVND